MNKQQRKELSQKYLGTASKYDKLMKDGILVPKFEAYTNPEGSIEHRQVFEGGVAVFVKKRYNEEEIDALFESYIKQEEEKKEKERLESLAKSARVATGISNQ